MDRELKKFSTDHVMETGDVYGCDMSCNMMETQHVMCCGQMKRRGEDKCGLMIEIADLMQWK